MESSTKKTLAIVIPIVTVLVGVMTLVWAVIQGSIEAHRSEVDFKNRLISQIAHPSGDAIVTARQIVANTLPQATGGPSEQAETREYVRIRREWLETRYEVGATLTASFSDEEIASEWNEFALAVEEYLRLSSEDTQVKAREQAVDRVTEYLGWERKDLHEQLDQPPERGGTQFKPAYFKASGELAEKLNDFVTELGGSEPRFGWP